VTPPLERFGVRGAFGAGGAQDVPEDLGP
jgi:hypothetical protein